MLRTSIMIQMCLFGKEFIVTLEEQVEPVTPIRSKETSSRYLVTPEDPGAKEVRIWKRSWNVQRHMTIRFREGESGKEVQDDYSLGIRKNSLCQQ